MMKINTSSAKLQKSLLLMLEHKSIEEISVKELCLQAKVHRSTFYDHYETIFDLYREVHFHAFEEILEAIKDIWSIKGLSVEGMAEVISIYESSPTLRSLLMGQGNASYFDRYLLEFFEPHLMVPKDFEMQCLFKSRSVAGTIAIREWLKEGRPCSKRTLAKLII